MLRESCGLTGEQAAEQMNCSQSKISKIELGRTGIRIGELGDLLDIYRVTDHALRMRLIALAESGNARGWWARYASNISRNYATYIGFESAARQITEWGPVRIPALLQTEDYARQVIRSGPREMTAPEIEQRVEILMERQAQVIRTDPGLWMITDESSLRRIVGSRDLMRDQLRHILQLVAERSRLAVQVLPFDVGSAHPGTVGALTVFEFPADPDVVYVETIAGDLSREGQQRVTCRSTVHQLQEAAISHDESISMIQQVMKEL
jgi:transcriptional regulator with XRE-family HTH domain